MSLRVWSAAVAAGCFALAVAGVTAREPGWAGASRHWQQSDGTGVIDAPRLLPGTRSDVFGEIQGKALTSTNAALPDAVVRLRDARRGQIVGTQVTDQSGQFAFGSLEPGGYVAEIIAQDGVSVLAASEVLYVAAGERVTAVVKLPLQASPLARLIGPSLLSASIVTAQAASAGVLAFQASGAATCEVLQ
jgi:hypothetical protein